MSRVILCRVGKRPHVTQLSADPDGRRVAALEEALGGPVACLALDNGIQLWGSRDGLVFGLALTRRVLAMSLVEPGRVEITLQFEGSDLGFAVGEWPANGDFLVARSTADGGVADLTESDIRQWMCWLGLDYILNR